MYKLFPETKEEKIENAQDQVRALVMDLYEQLDELRELNGLDADEADIYKALGSFIGENVDSYTNDY